MLPARLLLAACAFGAAAAKFGTDAPGTAHVIELDTSTFEHHTQASTGKLDTAAPPSITTYLHLPA